MRFSELDTEQIAVGQVASLDQASGENSVKTSSRLSPLATEPCIELLHDLNHAFAAVLMNAQVLDGKLPSYSRSKRYIHEIERGAQRGSALLKRLLNRLADEADGSDAEKELQAVKVPSVAERVAVANQGAQAAESVIGLATFAAANAAPAFSAEVADAHRKV
jgi:signal transduction histidine kinase